MSAKRKSKSKPVKRTGGGEMAAGMALVIFTLCFSGAAMVDDYQKHQTRQQPAVVKQPEGPKPVRLWKEPKPAVVQAVSSGNWTRILELEQAREAEALAMICEVKACTRDKDGQLRRKEQPKKGSKV